MSQTYRVLRAFGRKGPDGRSITVKEGTAVELDPDEAKPLAKINAIGLYFEDDDVEEAPPPPKRKRGRPRKNATVQDGA